jgi:hypothetical protein
MTRYRSIVKAAAASPAPPAAGCELFARIPLQLGLCKKTQQLLIKSGAPTPISCQLNQLTRRLVLKQWACNSSQIEASL